MSGADIAGAGPAALTALRELHEYLSKEREFNAGWIALHLRDGHPAAAERRREIVAERDRWIEALVYACSRLKVDG